MHQVLVLVRNLRNIIGPNFPVSERQGVRHVHQKVVKEPHFSETEPYFLVLNDEIRRPQIRDEDG